jgi:hypothetical protein
MAERGTLGASYIDLSNYAIGITSSEIQIVHIALKLHKYLNCGNFLGLNSGQ